MMDQTYVASSGGGLSLSLRAKFLLLTLAIAFGAFLAPPASFSNDGAMYADMARAMAESGSLHVGGTGGVEGAPALTKGLTRVHNGLVYPQYPSGYALIAAPFYLAFGVHGLMLMNALSFALCLYLTYEIAKRFYNAQIAAWAAAIFAVASFAPTYAFSIWPHMLALSFWMTALFFAVKAADGANRQSASIWLLASGAAIGAGINIRIDIFLAAIVIFTWLRVFSRPEDRLAPLALALGLAPGFILAAMLNHAKFGVYTPFTYASSGGATDAGRYAAVLFGVGAAAVLMWAFNIKKMFLKARRAYGAVTLTIVLTAGFLGAALLVPPLRDLFLRIGKGVYVLVINLQAHDAYQQEGVMRNEYGQLTFWDYPKKSLIQSLPYLPLIAAPVFYFFRGKNVSIVALSLLAVLGPVTFYALNQWHGGASYSMRYFMPAAPFIAILSAAGLAVLIEASGKQPRRQMLLAIVTAAVAAYLLTQEIARNSERFDIPVSLYPQWLIAAGLLFFLVAHLRAPSVKTAQRALMISLAAIAYGFSINIYEEITLEKTRAEQVAIGRDASAPIISGTLVFSQLPLLLAEAEAAGAVIMTATEQNAGAEAAEAATAFLAAGRCVLLHTDAQRELVEPFLETALDAGPLWAPSQHFSGDPRLAFYNFSGAPDACRSAFQSR